MLNGQPLAQGNNVQWLPSPGRHVLQITDARGKVLDEVRVEVRLEPRSEVRAEERWPARPGTRPAMVAVGLQR